MLGTDRKAAIAAYRERKTACGIYALRCAPTGQCWVGRAPDVETIGNRLEFTFAHDATLRPSLKAALRAHGRSAIEMEIVERFGVNEVPYEISKFLRDRQIHWCDRLGGEAI